MVGETEQRKRFAFALQQAMDARKLSARQLGKDLGGVDPRQISGWLKGRGLPNLYQAEALVHVLRVKEDLFKNPPPVPEPPPYPIGDYLLDEAKLPRPAVVPTSQEAGLAGRGNRTLIQEGARQGRSHELAEPARPSPSPKRPVPAK